MRVITFLHPKTPNPMISIVFASKMERHTVILISDQNVNMFGYSFSKSSFCPAYVHKVAWALYSINYMSGVA